MFVLSMCGSRSRVSDLNTLTFDNNPVNFVSAQLAVLPSESGNWLIRSIHWSSRRR